MVLSFAALLVAHLLAVPAIAQAATLPQLRPGSTCVDSLELAVFNAPRRPRKDGPLHILVVAEQDLADAQLVALTPKGELIGLQAQRYGGPPFGWRATIDKPALGTWHVGIGRGSQVDACQKVQVFPPGRASAALELGTEPVWQTRIKWERDTENLYSLWIEHLFDAPMDQDVSWNPLHDVLRDPNRNLLHNHLGLGEDMSGIAPTIDPDCADFPYVLRAYFSWKLGLPFSYRGCRRGNAKRAPTCGGILTNNQPAEEPDAVRAFGHFVRKQVQGTVHSSTLRTAPDDEKSDFYPVALNRHGLRPGTIYTDPYGHTLMVGRWYPQDGDKAGVLMAVDAQPDGTIGKRIFWKGSFLFPEDDAVKGAGWKRFRPLRAGNDGLFALSNPAIQQSPDYGDYALEQWQYGKEGFYEKMDTLISPVPMPPQNALLGYLDALDQQVRRRVESVENGEDWKRKNPGRTMTMPEGPAIFVTAGAWEDYSTPSRDLRLLIAIDTIRDFPKRVRRVPDRFRLPVGRSKDELERDLVALIEREARARSVTYRKSDGSSRTLTLWEVMGRTKGLETAYNPNDCIEVRWAEPDGSPEMATCTGRAPEAQRASMESYRAWFVARKRPLM
jgi:hypothetical protein